jgi:hypothetical protein
VHPVRPSAMLSKVNATIWFMTVINTALSGPTITVASCARRRQSWHLRIGDLGHESRFPGIQGNPADIKGIGQPWRKTAYSVLSCRTMAYSGVRRPTRRKPRNQASQLRCACEGGSPTDQGIADAMPEGRTGIRASTIWYGVPGMVSGAGEVTASNLLSLSRKAGLSRCP